MIQTILGDAVRDSTAGSFVPGGCGVLTPPQPTNASAAAKENDGCEYTRAGAGSSATRDASYMCVAIMHFECIIPNKDAICDPHQNCLPAAVHWTGFLYRIRRTGIW